MTHPLRRLVTAALFAAALAAPMVPITVTAPAASAGCPHGEVGITDRCAPFCLPGKYLSTQTGLCTPIGQPAPPPRP
jgi:hypothetical protein